jgi:hypothetical protein
VRLYDAVREGAGVLTLLAAIGMLDPVIIE